MFSKLFIVIVAVNAQGNSTSTSTAASPSSTASGFDSCALEYLTAAAPVNGCVNFPNITCVCTNDEFQADAGSCIALNCGQADAQAAVELQSAECSPLGLEPRRPISHSLFLEPPPPPVPVPLSPLQHRWPLVDQVLVHVSHYQRRIYRFLSHLFFNCLIGCWLIGFKRWSGSYHDYLNSRKI